MTSSTSNTFTLGLLHGDGIGPEIVPAAVLIADAAVEAAGGAQIDWRELPLGFEAIEEFNEATPKSTLEALAETDGWLLGPHDSAAYPEPFRSELNPSGTIRKHFDLYANVRPAKAFPGSSAVVAGTDLEIFGDERCFFASNFPVDGLFGSFDDLYTVYDAITAGLSAESRDRLFATNAEQVYRC